MRQRAIKLSKTGVTGQPSASGSIWMLKGEPRERSFKMNFNRLIQRGHRRVYLDALFATPRSTASTSSPSSKERAYIQTISK